MRFNVNRNSRNDRTSTIDVVNYVNRSETKPGRKSNGLSFRDAKMVDVALVKQPASLRDAKYG